MTSAAVAVTIAFWNTRRRFFYLAMAVVFAYTTIANIVERPEGIKIAAFFIGAIVFLSLLSRAIRSAELRISTVALDPVAQRFVDEMAPESVRIIAHRPDKRTVEEYDVKEAQAREDHSLDQGEPIVFLEVSQGDASDFTDRLMMGGSRTPWSFAIS